MQVNVIGVIGMSFFIGYCRVPAALIRCSIFDDHAVRSPLVPWRMQTGFKDADYLASFYEIRMPFWNFVLRLFIK